MFRKIFGFLFILFLLSDPISAQSSSSPYKIDLKTEITLPSISLSMALPALVLELKRNPLNEAELSLLHRDQVNSFDRGATFNWRPSAARWSDVLMFGSIASPLLFLAGEPSRKDFGRITLISTEVFLLNYGITYLTKELTKRKRPFVYNPDVPLDKKTQKSASHSFFSGHTSTTAAMSFSVAQMYSDYYPDSRAKPAVWVASSILPLAVGVLRNRAGKHYWTDVIVGYVVGMATGIVVPRLHRKSGFLN